MAGVVLVLACKVIKENDASCKLLNTLDMSELCRSKFDSLNASVQIALINVSALAYGSTAQYKQLYICFNWMIGFAFSKVCDFWNY